MEGDKIMKSKSFLTGLLIAGFSAFLVFSVFNFAFADWTEPGPCANGDGTPPSCNVPVPLNINAEYYSGNIDINGSYTGTIDGRQQIRMDLDASNCASSSILAWDGDNWHCTSTFSGIGLWSTSATNPNSIFNTNLSGRVGIGTDSPNNPLEVRGLYDSDNPKAQFSISNPTSTANLYLVNGVAAGGMSYNYGYNNLLDDTSRYGVDFLLDNNGFNLYSIAPVSLAKSNLMVVRADTGYVGIGTTTPNRHLHVYDTSINPEIDLQGVSGNNNHWAVYNNIGNGVSADSNSFNVWGGSTWLSILRNGNVGIGTSTPTRTLSIANNGGMSQIYMRTNNSTYGTYLVSGNSGSYWGANGDPTIGGGARDSSTLPIWYMGFSLYGLGSPSNPMGDFYRVARVNPGSSTSDTLFLVSGSGNVGIGTTTPKSNMELVGHMGSGGSRNLRVTFSTPSYPDGGQLKGTEFSALTNLRSDLNSDDPLNMGSNWTAMYAKAGSVAGNYAGMFNGDVSIFNDAGSAKLCLNGDCRTAWPASSTGSGSGSGVSFWSSSTVNTNDIYNNNSGNVGIGTNAPTSPLTVSSSSPQIALINPGSTMKMHLIGGVGAGGVGYNYTYNAANKLDDQGYYGLDLLLDATGKEFDFMGFSPGASPVKSNLMTIEADTGNIGIGTTSPNSSLHVYKDSGNSAEIDLQSVAGANNQWAIYNGRSDNSLRFWQGGDRLAILPGGNVGVGTTTPAAALEVVGTSKFSRGGHYLIVNPNYAVSNSYSQIQTDLPLIFATGGDYNRMYISSSTGNVGIGSMTPGAKLEVKSDLLTTTSGINKGSVHINPKFGSVGNVGSLTFGSYGNDSAEAGIYVPSDVSGTDMFFDTTNDYSSGAQSRMVLNHTGNLGLGVTSVDPSIKFNIYDATYGPMISLQGIDGNWKGLRFGDLANNEQWFAGVDGSSNYRLRRSSTVDYLNIDPIGHVGINTTAGLADKTLTVNGDIRVTSRFYDSSNNEGTAGYVLKSTATGTAWVATSTLGFGIGPSLPSGTTGQTLVNSTGTTWTATSAIFVSSTGNVGIGTLTPDNLLQVKDLVDFDSLGNTKLGYQASIQ